ncbi:unnamed protein product [Coccothraustes coccothraustes]
MRSAIGRRGGRGGGESRVAPIGPAASVDKHPAPPRPPPLGAPIRRKRRAERRSGRPMGCVSASQGRVRAGCRYVAGGRGAAGRAARAAGAHSVAATAATATAAFMS